MKHTVGILVWAHQLTFNVPFVLFTDIQHCLASEPPGSSKESFLCSVSKNLQSKLILEQGSQTRMWSAKSFHVGRFALKKIVTALFLAIAAALEAIFSLWLADHYVLLIWPPSGYEFETPVSERCLCIRFSFVAVIKCNW